MIENLLAKDRDQRYRSAEELLSDLEANRPRARLRSPPSGGLDSSDFPATRPDPCNGSGPQPSRYPHNRIPAWLAIVFAGAIFRFRCHLGKPNPAGSMLIDLGVGYLTNGEIEKAETVNPKALELQPDDSVALENGVGLSGILNPVADGEKYIAEAKRFGWNGTGLLGVELQLQGIQGDWDNLNKILAETAGRASANSGTHVFVLPARTAPVAV